jgi:hypothetical protein
MTELIQEVESMMEDMQHTFEDTNDADVSENESIASEDLSDFIGEDETDSLGHGRDTMTNLAAVTRDVDVDKNKDSEFESASSASNYEQGFEDENTGGCPCHNRPLLQPNQKEEEGESLRLPLNNEKSENNDDENVIGDSASVSSDRPRSAGESDDEPFSPLHAITLDIEDGVENDSPRWPLNSQQQSVHLSVSQTEFDMQERSIQIRRGRANLTIAVSPPYRLNIVIQTRQDRPGLSEQLNRFIFDAIRSPRPVVAEHQDESEDDKKEDKAHQGHGEIIYEWIRKTFQ